MAAKDFFMGMIGKHNKKSIGPSDDSKYAAKGKKKKGKKKSLFSKKDDDSE